MANLFQEYIQHGWSLCRIEPGTKGPRTTGWNERSNAVTDASNLQAAGLMHAYSGTCALDIDRYDDAKKWLSERGIDLDALMNAPDAVQIVSGRENRGKLLYALLDAPPPSRSVCSGAFELRCAAATGLSMQDVLPPSIHKDTGKPYEWKGDWKNLPPIPESLFAIWKQLLDTPERSNTLTGQAKETPQTKEITDLLSRRDPNCGYDEWLKCGMAVHDGTRGSNEGLAIWDNWSAPSDKYPGLGVLRSHWASFGRSANPITVDSLRRMDKATANDFDDVSGSLLDDEPPKPTAGFQFMSLDELFQRPEPSWIIPGILPEAALGAIYGQPAAGKTFAACDIALSIALGDYWRGKAVKQGGILYIAAEDDRGVQVRLAAGLAARGARNAPIRVLPAAPVLTDKGQKAALLEAVKREKQASIIFFDTLAAVTPGADENSGKDMGELLGYCHKIHKATGALVLLIHHEGKTAGRGARGWSGLTGAFEVIWEVSKDELQHELRIEKIKNAQDGMAYPFKLQPMGKSRIVEWL